MNSCIGNEDRCRYESYARFKPDEVVLSLSDMTGRFGIIVSGQARAVQIDEHGQEYTVDLIEMGEGFGEYFSYPFNDTATYIVANNECEVRFINLKKIITTCGERCEYKEKMLKQALLISCRFAQKQTIRLEIIRQRNLREKLLTYLRYQSNINPNSKTLEIPVTLKELANFLCVDRCAMMREIKKMNEDGLIKSSGRTFIICEGR